jgi:trk system potassium uptake protein TrkA
MDELVDTPLREMDLPEGILVAAIHRGLQVIIPDGSTSILEGDRVIFFSLLSELPELEALLSVSEPRFPFFWKRR